MAVTKSKCPVEIILDCTTYTEALSALYGCRAVLGDIANISHAINLMEAKGGTYNGFQEIHIPS